MKPINTDQHFPNLAYLLHKQITHILKANAASLIQELHMIRMHKAVLRFEIKRLSTDMNFNFSIPSIYIWNWTRIIEKNNATGHYEATMTYDTKFIPSSLNRFISNEDRIGLQGRRSKNEKIDSHIRLEYMNLAPQIDNPCTKTIQKQK